MFEEKIKEAIIKAVGKNEITLEIPRQGFGDYAFPCFGLARILKKNPNEIAKDLVKKIKLPKGISKAEAVGGYVNFFVDKEAFAEKALEEIDKKIKPAKKETIVVESPGPNTNKPLHVGHLRNLFIGDSIARINEFAGNKVFRVDIVNDRGIHICKSMLAYKKFGNNQTPEKAGKKSDHFVGDFYVLFSEKAKKNPGLEQEAQEMLRKWEQGDKETVELWKKMNSWVLDGMKETYRLLGFKHDKQYFESETYKKGKEIVMDGIKKKIFRKNADGSVSVDLKELGEKILLRQDGTAVYITQDIYLAEKRHQDYKFDRMFYVVASEQNHHFKVLFRILELLGKKWVKDCIHVSYGMVNLPSGKMKSREGIVIDADDLMDEVKQDAIKELKKRYGLKGDELEKRALPIALSAIKFALLKVDMSKDILFNKEEALDFRGFSGPYLQYTYARANSILRKTKKGKGKASFKNLDEREYALTRHIHDFPAAAAESLKQSSPHAIALYAYKLAQLFNDFYEACPVIDADKGIKERRIELVKAAKHVLADSLSMLGIQALEEM